MTVGMAAGYSDITIATLNIWGRKGKFDLRMKLIADELARLNPQVIFLQEVLFVGGEHPLISLMQKRGYKSFFEPALVSESNQYGNALLTNLPLQAVDSFCFPHTQTEEPRNVVGAELTSHYKRCAFFSTHLSHGDRLEQIREVQLALLDQLSQQHDLFVCGADLNMPPDKFQRIRLARNLNLRDPHDDPNFELEYAAAIAKNPIAMRRGVTSKLDYVLVGGRQSTDVKISNTEFFAIEPVDGTYPSDHLGICCCVHIS
jgi:endonuclease/exonuclease/phosphatase family metal-dependent hydrolase